MGETEVRTADASGQVKVQSPQQKPQAKSAKRAAAPKSRGPVFNERGVPITQWDEPHQDPNLRASVADSPDGAENEDFKAGKAALKKS